MNLHGYLARQSGAEGQKKERADKMEVTHEVTSDVGLSTSTKTIHEVREAGIVEAPLLEAGRIGNPFLMIPPSERNVMTVGRHRRESGEGNSEREQERKAGERAHAGPSWSAGYIGFFVVDIGPKAKSYDYESDAEKTNDCSLRTSKDSWLERREGKSVKQGVKKAWGA